MPEVRSKALGKTINIDRIIGRVDGANPGPCLIFIGGIHGNETAGVFALQQVVSELEKRRDALSGSFIAISGNLWALERSVRYQETDLNRLWNRDKLENLESGDFVPENEDEKQQEEIFKLIQEILKREKGPFYFFDLHTTSGATMPFITVNDSLLNRKFTQRYPVPLILGIEEYLEGPLLSYINELGYVSFGFEGGQHDDPIAIENHVVFIYLSLFFTGALNMDSDEFKHYLDHWKSIHPEHHTFYEIYDHFAVKKNDHFLMKPGFTNFQSIDRNEILATINGESILSKNKSIIFMPLYQTQGSEGYFLIRKIPYFFLWLSAILRKYKTDHLFSLLPGVKWSSRSREEMVVNLKLARFIAKQFFHLFGYRSKQKNKTHLYIKNREYRSKIDDYKDENWYKAKLTKQ